MSQILQFFLLVSILIGFRAYSQEKTLTSVVQFEVNQWLKAQDFKTIPTFGLKRLYFDPKINEESRSMILDHLKNRLNEATLFSDKIDLSFYLLQIYKLKKLESDLTTTINFIHTNFNSCALYEDCTIIVGHIGEVCQVVPELLSAEYTNALLSSMKKMEIRFQVGPTIYSNRDNFHNEYLAFQLNSYQFRAEFQLFVQFDATGNPRMAGDRLESFRDRLEKQLYDLKFGGKIAALNLEIFERIVWLEKFKPHRFAKFFGDMTVKPIPGAKQLVGLDAEVNDVINSVLKLGPSNIPSQVANAALGEFERIQRLKAELKAIEMYLAYRVNQNNAAELLARINTGINRGLENQKLFDPIAALILLAQINTNEDLMPLRHEWLETFQKLHAALISSPVLAERYKFYQELYHCTEIVTLVFKSEVLGTEMLLNQKLDRSNIGLTCLDQCDNLKLVEFGKKSKSSLPELSEEMVKRNRMEIWLSARFPRFRSLDYQASQVMEHSKHLKATFDYLKQEKDLDVKNEFAETKFDQSVMDDVKPLLVFACYGYWYPTEENLQDEDDISKTLNQNHFINFPKNRLYVAHPTINNSMVNLQQVCGYKSADIEDRVIAFLWRELHEKTYRANVRVLTDQILMLSAAGLSAKFAQPLSAFTTRIMSRGIATPAKAFLGMKVPRGVLTKGGQGIAGFVGGWLSFEGAQRAFSYGIHGESQEITRKDVLTSLVNFAAIVFTQQGAQFITSKVLSRVSKWTGLTKASSQKLELEFKEKPTASAAYQAELNSAIKSGTPFKNIPFVANEIVMLAVDTGVFGTSPILSRFLEQKFYDSNAPDPLQSVDYHLHELAHGLLTASFFRGKHLVFDQPLMRERLVNDDIVKEEFNRKRKIEENITRERLEREAAENAKNGKSNAFVKGMENAPKYKAEWITLSKKDKYKGCTTIKKLWRKLSMTFHADRNPGDLEATATFKKYLNEYEILVIVYGNEGTLE